MKDKYSGERITRGLYQTKNKRIINADINAALNIYKKSVTIRIVENGSVRELKNELIFDEIGVSAYIGIPKEE